MYEVLSYVVGDKGAMSSVAVGVYNSSSQRYTMHPSAAPILWPGNTSDTPITGRISKV